MNNQEEQIQFEEPDYEQDFEEIVEETFFSKHKMLVLICAAFLAIFSVLLLLPSLFNYDDLKFNLEQKISSSLNANFGTEKTSFALLPTPRIKVKNAEITNYSFGGKVLDFKIQELTVVINISSFFSRNFKISNIIISQALIESYHRDNPPQHKKLDVTKIFNQTPEKNSGGLSIISAQNLSAEDFTLSQIPLITIKNSLLQSYDKYLNIKNFSNINLKIKNKTSGTDVAGQFSIDNAINKIKLATSGIGATKTTKLTLYSPQLNLVLSGQSTPNSNKEKSGFLPLNFNGTLESEIIDVRGFYEKYINQNDFLSTKINPLANSIKIAAGIKKEGGEVNIDNIVINSELIKGKGNITLNFASKIPMYDIILDLENVNLDKLRIDSSIYESKPIDHENEYEKLLSKSITIPEIANEESAKPEEQQKNFEATAEITIKNVEYLKGQISDVDLYLLISSNNHSVLIQPLIFNIPGQGTARINGMLSGSSKKPKFVGKIDSFGQKLSETLKWGQIELQNLKYDNLKNYTLYSDLLILENSVALNNLYFTLNNMENEVSGNIKIENNRVRNILSNFNISKLNVDDYFFISEKNTYFSAGLLLKKMFWLNNINSNSITSLSFDNLIYKDEVFKNQKITFGLSRGYLEINNLELHSNNLDLRTGFIFDIRSTTPRLDASINAKKFHHKDDKKKSLLDEDTTSISENINLITKQSESFDFFDQFFALPSLSGINGNINFNFEDLTINDSTINDLQLSGKITDGSIDIRDMEGKIFDGSFNYQGQVILRSNKIINGSLNLQNIKIKPLLSTIFEFDKIDGIGNFTSSITAIAENKKQFADNLKLNTKFSAGNIELQGFGLNDLIVKMFQPQRYLQELTKPEEILFNQDATTYFDKVIGVVDFDKDGGNKLQLSFETTAANGVLNGAIDLKSYYIDATANIIFLTGNRETQIPINIASNIKGDLRNISHSSNIDQVKQYIDRLQGK